MSTRASGFWSIAWRQALSSLRHRSLRQALTGVGVALGVATVTAVSCYRASAPPDASALDLERLRWFGAAALAMCLIGVANSMFIAVAERIREIGTLKCLGASDGLIVAAFAIESAIIGAASSVIGSGLGVAAAAAIGRLGAPMESFAANAALGLSITMAASLIPAIQAARLPAAAALRVDV